MTERIVRCFVLIIISHVPGSLQNSGKNKSIKLNSHANAWLFNFKKKLFLTFSYKFLDNYSII
jgi:hypothetical protein